MVESTAPEVASEPTAGDLQQSEDNLTKLQVKLNELGEMFYTYLGILQRDAPPRGANKNENAELLARNIPEYAQDIVATSREIDSVIDAVEKDFSAVHDLDTHIREANLVSKKAGEELITAKNNTNNLLADVRLVTAMRDDDESDNK